MASDETVNSDATGTVQPVPTAAPALRVRRSFNPFRPIGPWPPGYLLLWILTLVSVIINVMLLSQLLLARRIAIQSIRDSIAVLENVQHQTINYTVEINEELPIEADIPINETVQIRIQDEFPINTSVTASVPIGPFGTFPVRVPVSTVVPIDRTVPITINQVFTLSTTVPVQFSVPISFAIEGSAFYATLEDTKARLILLEQELSQPLIPYLDNPGRNLPPTPVRDGNNAPTPTATEP